MLKLPIIIVKRGLNASVAAGRPVPLYRTGGPADLDVFKRRLFSRFSSFKVVLVDQF
jgi:hypothetical protein